MTDKQKKMLMEQIVDDVICDFVDISSGDLVLHYTNNTEDVIFQGTAYLSAPFSYSAGDIWATEGSGSFVITDIDRDLTALVQSAEDEISVRVFSACLAEPDMILDGPEIFTVTSVQVTSADNKVSLSLGKNSILGYNASSHTYNNRLFPGLY